MRCSYCHQDSDEPCVPEAFKEALEDLDSVGNRAEESPWSVEDEIEALYAEEDALYQTDDDDDDEDEDDWNGEFVSGPFDLSYLEIIFYHYPDGSFIEHEDPDYYYVTETGDHLLVLNDEEVGIVISAGWREIERVPRPGEKPFNI